MAVSTIGSAGLDQAANTTFCTTSGNVGIGTASPSAKLNVISGSVAQLIIGFSGTSASYLDSDLIVFRNAATTERMRIDSSGNIKLSTAGTTIQNSSGNPILRQTGSVIQVVNVQTGAYSSTTAIIPLDSTIPQNTEGTELFTVSITPTSSTSKLLIQANVMFTVTASQWCIIALFQDSTANALAAVPAYINIATAGITTSMQYFMTAGTTSATTFKLRYGQPTAGATIGINGPSGGVAFFGGVCISGMTVTEIAA